MVNYTLELFSDLCQPHDINSTKLKSYYNLHPAIPVCDVHTHTHTRTAIYTVIMIYTIVLISSYLEYVGCV